MASSRYPLDEIRARCDIAEIVSGYVALRRSGRSLKGLCPFHAEKTPSFTVNRDTQRWMCFGCGENGDIFSFLMRIEGLTFPEAVEQLASRTGVQVSQAVKDGRSAGERDLVLRVNNLAAVYFRELLQKSTEAKDYVRNRGVVPEAAEKFQLGYASGEWRDLSNYLKSRGVKPEEAEKAGLVIAGDRGHYDRFRNRLIFPIFDAQNRVIGFGGRALSSEDVKYINSPETRVFVKNRTLYALNFARRAVVEQDCVVIVEGYMDALTAHAAEFDNIVATMGTALTPEHVNILSRYTKRAVLAFDADSAGMSAAVRSAPMFEQAEFDVRVAAMPAGEDPDSLIRHGGRSAFAELVANAVPIPDYRIGMLRASHDTSAREGQLALLKEAIPIVAEVARQVERERLIALLAPYHPNFRSGTAPAEAHLRQEIDSKRARARTGTRAAPARPGNEKRINLLSEEGKAVRKAESELLGNIICRGLNPSDVFSELPPEEFVTEGARILAAAVQEDCENRGTLNIDELTTRVAATPGERFLNEILVTAAEPSDVPMADLIGAVKIYRKKEQEKRYRNLAERIERGEIKRTDKEFAEYWQLVRELHT
ncbi:MAG: DNA primase [Armatimonadetes bacterium]|nr:DNA primase [Armatimonadota bacterium]